MRRVTAQEAAEGDDGVVAAGQEARQRRNLEGAGDAEKVDGVVGRTMPRQTIERAGQQPRHDLVVEATGDDAEAQAVGVEVPFERTRH